MTTPSPFRSTTAFAARRRAHPVIERSVFVIVAHGAARLALPVEFVERVVRDAAADATVAYGDRVLPVHDLAVLLGGSATPHPAPDARLLVVRGHEIHAEWFALRVSAVYEVQAVETALVLPASAATEQAPDHPAVRGVFTRAEQRIWVIDPARLFTRPEVP